MYRVGIDGGCESSVHAVRQYVQIVGEHPELTNYSLLKMDIKNAFNSIHRKAVLDEVYKRCPEIYKLVWQSYSAQTPLFIGDTVIWSRTGVQQGDPLGPLCFSLAIDPIIQPLKSPINLWYLDDCTLAGPQATILRDLEQLVPKLQKVGLQLNTKKCEIFKLSPTTDPATHRQIHERLPDMKVLSKDNLTLLNSPIHPEATNLAVAKYDQIVKRMCERIEKLDSHTGLFFLTHHTSAPRLNYILRTAPIYEPPESLPQQSTM